MYCCTHCLVWHCRSGKLQVLSKVLAAWHKEGHKVLLFTQTQQMLDILEKMVQQANYSYHRCELGLSLSELSCDRSYTPWEGC
jgi:SNF2 family DNA or RNA helicase